MKINTHFSNTKSPKICFLIATLGHGRGGHFWDVKTIVEALREHVECVVINIGPYNSPVIDSIPTTAHNVVFKGLNFFGATRQVVNLLRQERVDVLNVFDTRIYSIARIASMILRKPLILTKCGGANPGRYYPYSDYLVVFSKENLEYFRNCRKYMKSEIYFIPNRVATVAKDANRIAKLASRIDRDKPTFLIIARFCEAYRNSMIQGVNLVKRLNADGHACQLLIVGVAENIEIFDEISQYEDDKVRIVNDEEFTLSASGLIDVADFIIAAGRGIMEAASRGKMLLTVLEDSPFPILITQKTFSDLFTTNFSSRNRVENLDVNQNYVNICRVLVDGDYRSELSSFGEHIFEEFFKVGSVVDKYLEIFNRVYFKRRFHIFNLVQAILTTLRSFTQFYLPMRKGK